MLAAIAMQMRHLGKQWIGTPAWLCGLGARIAQPKASIWGSEYPPTSPSGRAPHRVGGHQQIPHPRRQRPAPPRQPIPEPCTGKSSSSELRPPPTTAALGPVESASEGPLPGSALSATLSHLRLLHHLIHRVPLQPANLTLPAQEPAGSVCRISNLGIHLIGTAHRDGAE